MRFGSPQLHSKGLFRRFCLSLCEHLRLCVFVCLTSRKWWAACHSSCVLISHPPLALCPSVILSLSLGAVRPSHTDFCPPAAAGHCAAQCKCVCERDRLGERKCVHSVFLLDTHSLKNPKWLLSQKKRLRFSAEEQTPE